MGGKGEIVRDCLLSLWEKQRQKMADGPFLQDGWWNLCSSSPSSSITAVDSMCNLSFLNRSCQNTHKNTSHNANLPRFMTSASTRPIVSEKHFSALEKGDDFTCCIQISFVIFQLPDPRVSPVLNHHHFYP